MDQENPEIPQEENPLNAPVADAESAVPAAPKRRGRPPKNPDAVSAAPKPKKERPKGGTKDAEKLVRRLEREIEKQEQVVADFDRQIEAASADYQELTRLLGEKEEAEAALMNLMEQWEQAQA